MQNGSKNFIKGMGAGMVAGATVVVVSKMIFQDKHNITRGSSKLIRAMGDIVDGVQTMFK